MLVWDKDDAPAMDFVCAAANIRSQIFSIATNSRFQVRNDNWYFVLLGIH